MKLLLLSAALEDSTMSFPLASRLLQALLKTRFSPDRLEVETLDLTLDTPWEENLRRVKEALSRFRPGLAGFSVYLWNRRFMADLAGAVHEGFPEIRLIAGGPEATANPEALRRGGPFDYLVLGEGEETLPALLEALEKGNIAPDIPGVWIPGDTAPPAPAYTADPGAFPSPFLTMKEKWETYPGLLWETSRGCPFKCTFCYESRGSGKVRPFPLERIEKELALLAERGVDQVFLLDPAFNTDKKRALAILKAMARIAPDIHYTFEITAEQLTAEVADAFAVLEVSLQMGLQSSRPEILKSLNRRLDPEKFRRKCALLSERGIPFGVDLIYGLPGDSLEGFQKSLDYALDLDPAALDIFPLAILPGTVLGMQAAEGRFPGLTYRTEAPYTVITTPEFPAVDLALAEKLTAGVDEFFNKGRASTWYRRIAALVDLKPAVLMAGYSTWLEKGGRDTAPGVEDRQIAYLRSLSPLKEDENLAAAAESLIRLHQGLHRAAESGTAALELFHHPDQLDLLEEISLEEFARIAPPRHQEWLLTLEEEGFSFIPVGW